MAAASSRSEYYSAWDHFATKAASEDDEEAAATKAAATAAALQAETARYQPHGYEFRNGHKTQFPDCAACDGETDFEAAFRVATERRAAGVESFNDGSVWGAQMAVDAWGQGLLALERLKNLRKYKVLEAVSHETEEEPLAAATVLAAAGPGDEEIAAMVVGMRLNIAQALLKLREYESCVVHCDKALELDPCSTKGLWRKAKAVWGMRNPGIARESLNRLLGLEPSNAAAKAMLREIDQEEAKKRLKRTGVVCRARDTAPTVVGIPAARDAAIAAMQGAGRAEDDGSSDGEDGSDEPEESVAEFVLAHCQRCCRRKREKAE